MRNTAYRMEKCPDCGGNGYRYVMSEGESSYAGTCPACKGVGYVKAPMRHGDVLQRISLEDFAKFLESPLNHFKPGTALPWLLSEIEAIEEPPLWVFNVGFNGNDETQVDAATEEEAIELARQVATESGVGFELNYINRVAQASEEV